MKQLSTGSIGDYLRELRERAQITLRERAREVGLDPGYLSRLEAGKITAGPAAIGRVLVALTDQQAQDLLRRYFEDAAATITHERARVIKESGLKSDRRELKIGIATTYSKAK